MNKKKIIIGLVSILVLGIVTFIGLKWYVHAHRPDLNGNEKIVSMALDEEGKPIDIIGLVPNVDLTKDTGAVYLSIPVNSKKMTECRVTLSLGGIQLEEKIIPVSDARYVTYYFDNLANRESGLYQFAFYDSNNEVNVYAAIEVKC